MHPVLMKRIAEFYKNAAITINFDVSMGVTEPSEKKRGMWRKLSRAWFCLARTERLALAVVLGLLLLGLCARWHYLSRERPEIEAEQSGDGG